LKGFIDKIRTLIQAGDIRISEHGYDELAEDGLTARERISGIEEGKVLEVYLEYPKGPCALFLQKYKTEKPIHVVWGVPKGQDRPIVLITAYRPDPRRWDQSFTRRLKR
jgi:hypothetical protein